MPAWPRAALVWAEVKRLLRVCFPCFSLSLVGTGEFKIAWRLPLPLCWAPESLRGREVGPLARQQEDSGPWSWHLSARVAFRRAGVWGWAPSVLHGVPCPLAAPVADGSSGARAVAWACVGEAAGLPPSAAGFTVRPPPLPTSSGPQNCAACVNEGIYEEGVSILESSSVSEPSTLTVSRGEGTWERLRERRPGPEPPPRLVVWGARWVGGWAGAYPRDALSPGFPGQCCPQGGGEPAGRLFQRGLHLEGDPEGVRGRGCPALAEAPPAEQLQARLTPAEGGAAAAPDVPT